MLLTSLWQQWPVRRLQKTKCFTVWSNIQFGLWDPAIAGSQHIATDQFRKTYTIRFTGEFAELTGVDSTETLYYCKRAFPNKATDVVTCVNSRVATMVFNYSTESGRFVLNMVSPGGWLSVGTERAQDEIL